MAQKKTLQKKIEDITERSRREQRNEKIGTLIKKLKLDDNNRHESLEELISQAHQIIESNVDTFVVGKDNLLNKNYSAIQRKFWAIELLAAMIQQAKKLVDTKDQQPTNTGAITQTFPTTGTLPQPADTGITGVTTRLAQTGATTQLPQTGTTVPLVATGQTTPLPVTGQTVPLPATGATVPLAAGATLAAIPLVHAKTLKDYQIHIGQTTGTVMNQIAQGAYGPQLQNQIKQKPLEVRELIEAHVSQKTYDLAAFTDYDFMARHKEVPQIANALKRRSILEDQLYNEGLLDEGLLNNKTSSAFKNYYEGNIVDKAWDGVGPTQTISNAQLTENVGPRAQASLLTNFKTFHPNIASDYPKLFANAREQLAKRGVKMGAEKVARGAAAKVGGTVASGALTGALSFLGPIAPIVSKAITWLGGKLVIPVYKFLRRRAKNIAQIGAGLLGLGALTGSALLSGLGVGLIGISLAGGGPALMAGSIGSGISTFFGVLGTLLLAAIVAPIVVTFITIVALTAFIFLIINNSGYVTPFSRNLITDISTPAESLFMSVQKTASRSAIPNGPWPQTVTYTITINALESDLTNISYNNSYQITQDPSRATPPSATLPAPPSTITQGTSHSFTYTVDYTESFRNSLVCDTFEVTATVGSTTDSASSTACVTIGTSPVVNECPSGWPVDTSRGQRYVVTQGPNTTYSHPGEELDVATSPSRSDSYVIATHAGTIVSIFPRHAVSGNYILVRSTCNGRQFDSYYGHMRNESFGAGLSLGQQITRGTRLGLVGRTGAATGDHVHYQFNGGLQMAGPYIPVPGDSLRGCVGYVACGSINIP